MWDGPGLNCLRVFTGFSALRPTVASTMQFKVYSSVSYFKYCNLLEIWQHFVSGGGGGQFCFLTSAAYMVQARNSKIREIIIINKLVLFSYTFKQGFE